MVRVKAPLMSLDASGTVGKSIVFAAWKGRNYVRRHAIPANPNSGLQVGIRAVFKLIAQDFKNLAAGQKNDWILLAAADNITPLDAQIRDAVQRARRNLGPRMDNTAVDPGAIDAPTGGTAVVQPKTLVVGWTEPAANKPDYAYMLYSSIATGFTPDISNLIAVIKFPTITFTHTHLITGTPYYYRVRGISKSGKLGTLLAQWTGTPT